MARYSASYSSITHAATADAANLANSTYGFEMVGGSTTNRILINEVYIGGEAAASAPSIMRVGRDSTIAAGTPAAGNALLALLDASAGAPATIPTLVQTVVTTAPQRSATLGRLLALSFNAFGGIVRWQARFGEEITSVGNTASLGALSISAFTGSTAAATSGYAIVEVV